MLIVHTKKTVIRLARSHRTGRREEHMRLSRLASQDWLNPQPPHRDAKAPRRGPTSCLAPRSPASHFHFGSICISAPALLRPLTFGALFTHGSIWIFPLAFSPENCSKLLPRTQFFLFSESYVCLVQGDFLLLLLLLLLLFYTSDYFSQSRFPSCQSYILRQRSTLTQGNAPPHIKEILLERCTASNLIYNHSNSLSNSNSISKPVCSHSNLYFNTRKASIAVFRIWVW